MLTPVSRHKQQITCGNSEEYTFHKKKGETAPWEVCRKLISKHDKDTCSAWQGEIDNLLIFGGLFSAVVTAFTIESYKWLKEDSSATTAALIHNIAVQLYNVTNPTTDTPREALFVPGQFTANPSDIAINVLWFLSLALSLTAVLLGTLCQQWIRSFLAEEVMSDTEALKRRQLRYDGLEHWKVPNIVASLPVLLQLALVFFFLGLFVLLSTLHPSLAAIAGIPIVFSLVFLVGTTFAPTCQFIFAEDTNLCIEQCPYKSPQSWLVRSGGIRVAKKVLAANKWKFPTYKTLWDAVENRFRHKIQKRVHPNGIQRKKSSTGTVPEKPDSPHKKRNDMLGKLLHASDWNKYDGCWHQLREENQETEIYDIAKSLAWMGNNFILSETAALAAIYCIEEAEKEVKLEVDKMLNDGYEKQCEMLGQEVVRDPLSIAERQQWIYILKNTSNDCLARDIGSILVLDHFARLSYQLEIPLAKRRLELYMRCINSLKPEDFEDGQVKMFRYPQYSVNDVFSGKSAFEIYTMQPQLLEMTAQRLRGVLMSDNINEQPATRGYELSKADWANATSLSAALVQNKSSFSTDVRAKDFNSLIQETLRKSLPSQSDHIVAPSLGEYHKECLQGALNYLLRISKVVKSSEHAIELDRMQFYFDFEKFVRYFDEILCEFSEGWLWELQKDQKPKEAWDALRNKITTLPIFPVPPVDSAPGEYQQYTAQYTEAPEPMEPMEAMALTQPVVTTVSVTPTVSGEASVPTQEFPMPVTHSNSIMPSLPQHSGIISRLSSAVRYSTGLFSWSEQEGDGVENQV